MSARTIIRDSRSVLAAVEHLTDEANLSALEAERRGLHLNWPTWPLGVPLSASWQWLLFQVEAGTLPDVPCRWSPAVLPGRSVIYWLDTKARTRHIIIDESLRILTGPLPRRRKRQRLH